MNIENQLRNRQHQLRKMEEWVDLKLEISLKARNNLPLITGKKANPAPLLSN